MWRIRRIVRLFFTMLAALAAVIPYGWPAMADEWCDTVRVGGAVLWPPYIFSDGDNRYGPMIDAVSDIFADTGFAYEYLEQTPWMRTLAGLETGSVDMIFSALKSPAREERFLLSRPFMSELYAFFALVSRQDITARMIREPGFTVTAYRGLPVLDTRPELKWSPEQILFVDKPYQLIRVLLARRADVTIAPVSSFWVVADTMDAARNFREVPETRIVTPVVMMMKRDGPCTRHLPALNAAIERWLTHPDRRTRYAILPMPPE